MHPILEEQEKEFERRFEFCPPLEKIIGESCPTALALKSFLRLSNLAVAEAVLKMVEGRMPKKETEPPHAGYTPVEASIYSFAKAHNFVLNHISTTLLEIRKQISELK